MSAEVQEGSGKMERQQKKFAVQVELYSQMVDLNMCLDYSSMLCTTLRQTSDENAIAYRLTIEYN